MSYILKIGELTKANFLDAMVDRIKHHTMVTQHRHTAASEMLQEVLDDIGIEYGDDFKGCKWDKQAAYNIVDKLINDWEF